METRGEGWGGVAQEAGGGEGKRGQGPLLCPCSTSQPTSTTRLTSLLHLHALWPPMGSRHQPLAWTLMWPQSPVPAESHHQRKQGRRPEARGNMRNLKENTRAGSSSLEEKCPQSNSTVGGTPTGALSHLPGRTSHRTERVSGIACHRQHWETLSKYFREAGSSPTTSALSGLGSIATYPG